MFESIKNSSQNLYVMISSYLKLCCSKALTITLPAVQVRLFPLVSLSLILESHITIIVHLKVSNLFNQIKRVIKVNFRKYYTDLVICSIK